MASRSKKIKDFQIDLLSFLRDKNIHEVHIYNHVMNYWSNDSSMISLQDLKSGITDLCNRNMIISKGNAHNSIGVQGVPEEYQKENAICVLQKAGLDYINRIDLISKIKNVSLIVVVMFILLLLWYNRHMISYFFR